MDSAVDRRNADETAAMLQLDLSDNLLWRPVVLQDADLDVGSAEVHAQGAYADDRLPCVACRVLVQSMGNMVNRSRIAAKLTRNGRLAALQQMGNLRDRFALSKEKEYLFSLNWCKMCVVAHRLSFCYR